MIVGILLDITVCYICLISSTIVQYFRLLLTSNGQDSSKNVALTGSVRALCTNFLVQAVMLVTLAKQADISPRACTSTCTRTDLLTFTSICRLQSRAVPLVT